MSIIKEITTSDSEDEFQDAVNNTTNTTTNAQVTSDEAVEELTKQQADLKLPKDADTEGEGDDDEEAFKDSEGATAAEPPKMFQDDIDEEELKEKEKTLSEEELKQNKETADKLKLQGNELFKNDKAEEAIQIYTDALKICPTLNPKERAVLFGNRAAAKIKLDSKKSAIEDCTKAINLWPEYVRVILRRAKLYEHEENLEEALEDYKRVNELEPGQREACESLSRLPPLINERNERLKEEMMSKLKDLGNMILKPFGLSTSNFQMQQDPNTGSYSINFNQNQNSS